ncbi:hypothetical protein DFH09DRAFT_1322490 [Mycena vulgaris]|nr:hypothetical protein DFH09DRAFT_1322490 [Mycena vulgaris]
MEKNRDAADAISAKPTTDVNVVNKMAGENILNVFHFCESALLGEVTLLERNLGMVWYEPRCMLCARSDQEIRMKAASNGVDNCGPLIPCPDCNLSFCCSPAHWEAVRALHRGPYEEACDGLSQCEMNKESEFHDERTLGVPPSSTVWRLLRAASDDLSMVMTILYGLEKLNDGDGWTRKHTLTVHIIGANETEVSYAAHPAGFEEILHSSSRSKDSEAGPCAVQIYLEASCRKRPSNVKPAPILRSSVVSVSASSPSSNTYHSFVALTDQWLPTLKLLVEHKIPTVFTSLDREEAEGEAALLRTAGATLHSALGPSKIPGEV